MMNNKVVKSYWSLRRSVHANVATHVAEIENNTHLSTSEITRSTASLIDGDSCTCNEHNDMTDIGLHVDNSHVACEPTCMSDPNTYEDAGLWEFEHTEVNYPDTLGNDDIYDFLDLSDCLSDTDTDTLSQSGSETEDNEGNLRYRLAECFVQFNISHAAAAALLQVLRPYHPNLPKDPRTLLATPTDIAITELAGGNYHHVGIEKSLTNIVERHCLEAHELGNIVYIQINIDGLPIFKSSGLQFWPILGLLKRPIVSEPFVIGIYSGYKKPQNLAEYLSHFVAEAKQLEVGGCTLLGKTVLVKIHSFVCDAPARSFLKNTKSFSGYYGCDRCIQAGKHINGRMTYPEVAALKRTDDGFATMIYDEHHLSDTPSPLAQLSVGLVSSFVLDYQHLVCLGVVRRLIITWLRGPLSCRLPARKVLELSRVLEQLRSYTPSDLSRKPRGLADIDRWKATEFRQFLLFTSPLVLRGFLPEALYKHFMLLHVALTCLVSQNLSKIMCDYAEKLLVIFVTHGCKLYGPQFLVYNVHCLIHLADDVRRFGSLDGISCFPFENHLGKLKKTVRSPSNPLQQVINRISEQQMIIQNHTGAQQVITSLKGEIPVIDQSLSNLPLYSTLHTRRFILSSKNRDNCVMLSGKRVGRIEYFYEKDSTFYVAVRLYVYTSSYYDYPLPSEDIGIFCVGTLSNSTCIVLLTDIVAKCYCMPTSDEKFLVVPMHH